MQCGWLVFLSLLSLLDKTLDEGSFRVFDQLKRSDTALFQWCHTLKIACFKPFFSLITTRTFRLGESLKATQIYFYWQTQKCLYLTTNKSEKYTMFRAGAVVKKYSYQLSIIFLIWFYLDIWNQIFNVSSICFRYYKS